MNKSAWTGLREEIRTAAFEMGFAACGFTSAETLPSAGLLADWVAEGRCGTMEYLARDISARVDPSRILPRAASVVVAAWPYPAPPAADPDWARKLTGRIAAYALGRDYHALLSDRLGILARLLASVGGGQYAVHVDAGPLVEKELARRAGIGWYGRNTNILGTRIGSYFLLGCLVTDVALPPDEPFETSHCGTCTTCIPACPTGALDHGVTIDARLCISYLTIEHRGPIAEDLRERMDNWVFGCDLCQQACPWNDAGDHRDAALEPFLPDLLALSPQEFRERYGATAVARAKRRGLARNAAIALGNSRNPDAVQPLAWAVLQHDEALVRAHAAWGLGRIGGRAARSALLRADRLQQVPPVARAIETALSRVGSAGSPAGHRRLDA